MTFDLACIYSGETAMARAEARGVSIDLDIFVTNDNPTIRTVIVKDAAVVHELQFHSEGDGGYTSPVPVPYSEWPSEQGRYICDPSFNMCPVWLAVNDGVATEILEQYFP